MNESPNGNLDMLLRKYIAVWLWSILFGGTTGLTYTLISYSSGDHWGHLGLVLGAMTACGIYVLLLAWFYLYIYLKNHLIPVVVMGKDIEDPSFLERGGRILTRAYMLMIIAGVIGLSTKAVQYLFQAI
jgi:hypothetical protein